MIDIKFTRAGKIATGVLVAFIIIGQQCNIHTLSSRPAPIVEHIKVFDTIRTDCTKPQTFPEGTKFFYTWKRETSNDSGEYTTTIYYKKDDLIKLPVGEKNSIEIVRIQADGIPLKN